MLLRGVCAADRSAEAAHVEPAQRRRRQDRHARQGLQHALGCVDGGRCIASVARRNLHVSTRCAKPDKPGKLRLMYEGNPMAFSGRGSRRCHDRWPPTPPRHRAAPVARADRGVHGLEERSRAHHRLSRDALEPARRALAGIPAYGVRCRKRGIGSVPSSRLIGLTGEATATEAWPLQIAAHVRGRAPRVGAPTRPAACRSWPRALPEFRAASVPDHLPATPAPGAANAVSASTAQGRPRPRRQAHRTASDPFRCNEHRQQIRATV